MLFFCRVEGGDASWKLYWLPVAAGGAEPQEGGGIAWAWIIDPKVYPTIPMPNDGVQARGNSGGYRQPFCYNFGVFVDNTCQGLLADQLDSSGSRIW